MTTPTKSLAFLVLPALCLLLAVPLHSLAAPQMVPKTSQHVSFKPENFERLAVIVKPIKAQRTGRYGRGVTAPRDEQAQTERLIEQNFMRAIMAGGYTLVSRMDLDAAMKEKGLDQANMTDEKRDQEAGKLLHVSCLLIVTVDSFAATPAQLPAPTQAPAASPTPRPRSFGRSVGRNGPEVSSAHSGAGREVCQIAASVSARLVKIDDNMVMWTGDLAVSQLVASPEYGSAVLAAAAEAIAQSFPPLPSPDQSPSQSPRRKRRR